MEAEEIAETKLHRIQGSALRWPLSLLRVGLYRSLYLLPEMLPIKFLLFCNLKYMIEKPQNIRLVRRDKLVVASHNPGKVREFRALLAPYGVKTVSAAELDLPDPQETGTSFLANSEIKARIRA